MVDDRPRPLGRKHSASIDRKSTRLNSSHSQISYAVFCLKKKKSTIPESLPFEDQSQPIHRRRLRYDVSRGQPDMREPYQANRSLGAYSYTTVLRMTHQCETHH